MCEIDRNVRRDGPWMCGLVQHVGHPLQVGAYDLEGLYGFPAILISE